MERRAAARQQAAQERRERRRCEEERRAQERCEAEEASKLKAEVERVEQERLRREAARECRRRRAEQLVATAVRRRRMQQAEDFCALRRLVDGWCAFREATILMEERCVLAFYKYRRRLLRIALGAWTSLRMRSALVREACQCAMERLALQLRRRQLLRFLLHVFRCLGEEEQQAAQAARSKLLQSKLGRYSKAWLEVALARIVQREHLAVQHFARWFQRRFLDLWRVGAINAKFEDRVTAHKNKLLSKVSGWLTEMDSVGFRKN